MLPSMAEEYCRSQIMTVRFGSNIYGIVSRKLYRRFLSYCAGGYASLMLDREKYRRKVWLSNRETLYGVVGSTEKII